jgi:hypothetical protein
MVLPPIEMTVDAPAYPAIAACVGDGRRPTLGELRRVIRRLRRELFLDHRIDAAVRRRISLAALIALGVIERRSQ